jgi:hypothetical protein
MLSDSKPCGGFIRQRCVGVGAPGNLVDGYSDRLFEAKR